MGKRILFRRERDGEVLCLVECVTDPENPTFFITSMDRQGCPLQQIEIHRDDIEAFAHACLFGQQDMLKARSIDLLNADSDFEESEG